MLDYARQRAIETLRDPRTVVLATSGPAGVQASELRCEAMGLELYLLVPQTSDHLFNLEHEPTVTLLTTTWELKGEALIVPLGASHPNLNLLKEPESEWCAVVRVEPSRLQIQRGEGWGNVETIDLQSH